MTTNASRTQLLRGNVGRMTGVATELGMRPGQHKLGIARVVEAGRLPIGAAMTLLALLTHASGMRILRLVTTLTILGNFVFHASGGVTTSAIGTCMRAV